jgi:hypothetical protein
MALRTRTIKVSTSGTAGSAVGETVSTYMAGELLDIYINYHASAPATTDVTITHQDAFRGTVLEKLNSSTDTLYAPRVATHKNTDGTATGAYDRIALNGTLKVAVAGCDALTDAVVVVVTYML